MVVTSNRFLEMGLSTIFKLDCGFGRDDNMVYAFALQVLLYPACRPSRRFPTRTVLGQYCIGLVRPSWFL